MNTKNASRRTALKLLLAGSVVSVGTGCSALNSLPRGQRGGTTDGSELALRVRDALRNHPDTAQLIVNITSVEDEVIIKGQVNRDADIVNVNQVANQVEGVRYALVDLYVRK